MLRAVPVRNRICGGSGHYEWVPTCHRVSYDDFMQDVDYQMALEYSDGIVGGSI